jgi:hypothetical protein
MKTLKQFLDKFSFMIDGYIGSYSNENKFTIALDWFDEDGNLNSIDVPVDTNGVFNLAHDDVYFALRFYTEVLATNDWD